MIVTRHAHPKARADIVQPEDPTYRLIALTRGQVTAVDTADYDWLMQWNWVALMEAGKRHYRVVRAGGIIMPRLIMNAPKGSLVDHRDHDTLNNRRSNLRVCSHLENARNAAIRSDNTCGFRGVSWNTRESKWKAQIRFDGRRLSLGYFKDLERAIQARIEGEVRLFGEFANIQQVSGTADAARG